jgi:hypothetical protein
MAIPIALAPEGPAVARADLLSLQRRRPVGLADPIFAKDRDVFVSGALDIGKGLE